MKTKFWALLLMCALVVGLVPASSIHVQAEGLAFLRNKKAPSIVLTDQKITNIYVGGSNVNLDYVISGKTSGVKGSWKSSDESIVTVDKYGICRAVNNGTVDISFTYEDNGTAKELRCSMKALTRATGITLTPSGTVDETMATDGSMEIGQTASFHANLETNPKALAINQDVTTTYLTYYYLYEDAECTREAGTNVATVDQDGTVTAVGAGTVYLRAIAKNTPNAKNYNQVSMAIPIRINGAETSTPTVDQNGTETTTPTVDQNGTGTTTPTVDQNGTGTTTPTVDQNGTGTTTPTVDQNGTGTTTPTVDQNTPQTTKPVVTVKQVASNKFQVASDTDILSVIIQNTTTGSNLPSSLSYDVQGSKKSVVVTTVQSTLVGNYKLLVSIDGYTEPEAFTVTCEAAKPTKLELISQNGTHYAILDKLAANGSSYPKAYVYFAMYDQFGNNITSSYPASSFIGVWVPYGAVAVQMTDPGVMVLDFQKAGLTIPEIGKAYEITIIYNGASDVKITDTVYLGSPVTVSSLAFKGIYQYTNIVEGYKKVADMTTCNIVTGTQIIPYSTDTPTTTAGSYYLVVSAKDQYGNVLARSGVSESTVSIYFSSSVDGGTNLKLGTTSSVGSVTIDGESCLAYPLVAISGDKTLTGSTTILLSPGPGGTATASTWTLKVGETAGIASFIISGTGTIRKSGTSHTPVEGYVNYTVLSTSGSTPITNYDTLVALTKAIEVSGTSTTSTTATIYDQTILSSAYGSLFRWEKQADGSARLLYTPSQAALISSGMLSSAGIDTIITLKGTSAELTNQIVVQVTEY